MSRVVYFCLTTYSLEEVPRHQEESQAQPSLETKRRAFAQPSLSYFVHVRVLSMIINNCLNLTTGRPM